jgi:hypothetical protein
MEGSMSQRWAAAPLRICGFAFAAIALSAGAAGSQDHAGAGAVKVPVTTSKADARQEYL